MIKFIDMKYYFPIISNKEDVKKGFEHLFAGLETGENILYIINLSNVEYFDAWFISETILKIISLRNNNIQFCIYNEMSSRNKKNLEYFFMAHNNVKRNIRYYPILLSAEAFIEDEINIEKLKDNVCILGNLTSKQKKSFYRLCNHPEGIDRNEFFMRYKIDQEVHREQKNGTKSSARSRLNTLVTLGLAYKHGYGDNEEIIYKAVPYAFI